MIFYLYTFPGMHPGGLVGLVASIRDVPGGYAASMVAGDGVRCSVYIGDRPSFVMVCPD